MLLKNVTYGRKFIAATVRYASVEMVDYKCTMSNYELRIVEFTD